MKNVLRPAPLLALFALLFLPVSCGGGGDAPPAAVGSKCTLAAKTPSYPATGCGIDVGTVIDNYEFTGKDAAKGGVSAPKHTFRLGDFFDPTGTDATRRFLLVSVAALWCAPCRDEAAELPAYKNKYGPMGVIFLTDVAEGASQNPSTDADLDSWISKYYQNTLIVNDADFVLRLFFDKKSMPLNMIVDLKTMKIVHKMVGKSDASFWTKLDGLLAGK